MAVNSNCYTMNLYFICHLPPNPYNRLIYNRLIWWQIGGRGGRKDEKSTQKPCVFEIISAD